MLPFFTIITPTYNRPDLLKRAVNSVLNQGFKDFEYIIVNNSSDELILDIADPRIKIINDTRKGANYARNAGIEHALADFICFLDDDDAYYPNHLDVLYNLVKSNKYKEALYRTFTCVENEKNKFINQEIILKKDNETDLEHLLKVLLVMNCVCCHKKIFLKHKFDTSIPVAQDYHLWIRILADYPIVEAPVITTVYYKTTNSISSENYLKYYKYIEVYKSLLYKEHIYNKISDEIINSRLLRYYDLLLSGYYKKQSIKKFIKNSYYAVSHNSSYVFSIHYFKIFMKFWLCKIHIIK